MSTTLIYAIIGVVGACVTGFVTWLVARRNTSGSAETTDAATLWQESQAMRRELRDEVIALRAENAQQLEQILTLRANLDEAERRNRSLEEKLKSLQGKLGDIGEE